MTMTRNAVWVWRMVNEVSGDAFPFYFQEYGFGKQIEASYATEEEAREDYAKWRHEVADDEVVLALVDRSELEVR